MVLGMQLHLSSYQLYRLFFVFPVILLLSTCTKTIEIEIEIPQLQVLPAQFNGDSLLLKANLNPGNADLLQAGFVISSIWPQNQDPSKAKGLVFNIKPSMAKSGSFTIKVLNTFESDSTFNFWAFVKNTNGEYFSTSLSFDGIRKNPPVILKFEPSDGYDGDYI